jgi:hypothetical protein
MSGISENSGVGLHKIHCIFKVHVQLCTRLYFKGIQAVRIEFYFLLKVANIQCFILIAVDIFQNIIPKYPMTSDKNLWSQSISVNENKILLFQHPVQYDIFPRSLGVSD